MPKASKREKKSKPVGESSEKIEVAKSLKVEKKKLKRKARLQRKREVEMLGDDAPSRQQPHTLDTLREFDETIVEGSDSEVEDDVQHDEFQSYFSGDSQPKILLTTSDRPSAQLYEVVREILDTIPATTYYARRQYSLKDICKFASSRGFTDVMVLVEDRPRRKWHKLIISHLPDGPTAVFRISSFVPGKKIRGHGVRQLFKPEIILNGFVSRLGQTVGRMLGSLAPQSPTFAGRSAITFHNQRDYIFFRHHRYIFKDNKSAGLQELGPRFTMKLKSLQKGSYDVAGGEFVWVHKPEMDTSRRRFFL